jgi:hypothetical protein
MVRKVPEFWAGIIAPSKNEAYLANPSCGSGNGFELK